jgi:hypothetical protein
MDRAYPDTFTAFITFFTVNTGRATAELHAVVAILADQCPYVSAGEHFNVLMALDGCYIRGIKHVPISNNPALRNPFSAYAGEMLHQVDLVAGSSL